MRSLTRLGLCAVAAALAVAGEVNAAAVTAWHCRNADVEIGCHDGRCAVAEAHTPMDVHVDAGSLRVCAYTGCWAGAPAAVLASGPFVTFSATALAFSTAPADRADISVTVDTRSRVATILVAGRYATPATCKPE
jgi:hypothetical protein